MRINFNIWQREFSFMYYSLEQILERWFFFCRLVFWLREEYIGLVLELSLKLCKHFVRRYRLALSRMEEGCRERLLKKNYYEDCPGCKVDQYKESQRGFPFREFFSMWIIVLGTGNYSVSHTILFMCMCFAWCLL